MQKIAVRVLIAGLSLLSFPSYGELTDKGLEPRLRKALQIRKNGQERQARSRPVILAYKQAGILGKVPQQRADYIDFYLLRKPASFMGHRLVLLEEEYMDSYVGCCVSPGMGLAVQVHGDTSTVQEFAQKNACTFTAHADLAERLKTYGISHWLPKADYATLSCRERDLAVTE
ncbi:hypothetical protein [Undibacterium sp. TS12]|uniref:hypothetical protein n=1 Tax=Undibacterium sp. TS12 TaxID=2908202 RepID=UPI001F4C8BC7|nr:hypothetical protein [Undibacterium sp. TS12]MCH8621794.1 hypothetical protein [Undibacterium sp. TS12]